MFRRNFIAVLSTKIGWKQVGGHSTGPSRVYLSAGPAPLDTVIDGITYDQVLFVDQVDSQLKVLKKDGSTQALAK